MRPFCGWIDVAGGSAQVAAGMLAAGSDGAAIDSRGGERWHLALGGGPGAAVSCAHAGLEMLLLGEPRWRDDPGGPDTAQQGTADRVAAAFEDGVRGFGGLRGNHAVIVLDPGSGRLCALVDRFAVHPVYFARVQEGVVFGSSPRIVAAHPRVPRELSEQALFDYFYATAVPAPATVFRGVRALAPGTGVEFHGGVASEHVHWQPAFVEDRPSAMGTAAEREVLDRLRAAVDGAARQVDSPGCFLSGGIDSSTVVGLLAGDGARRPRTFSIGFDVGDYDELHYARVVARHFDAQHQEYYVTPQDIVALLPRIARAFGQPFGNSSVVPAFQCARLAREHGVTCLLAGDGGDELFGGNERYGRDWLFSLYGRLPRTARRALEHWADAPAPLAGGLPVARKALSYVRHARVPLPQRLEIFNYVNVLGPGRLFEPDFLSGVDTGAGLEARRAMFWNADASSDINRMLAMEFKTTLADNDLPKVNVMCREAGVDVRFPFLDDAVVDFSLGLPATDKVSRTRLRCFFRKAVSDFLPREVITKSKHGFGLPFGIWASRPGPLRECVFDLLGAARGRGIVAGPLIDELKGGLLDAQPRYYGPLVWLIIVLEGWLAENC